MRVGRYLPLPFWDCGRITARMDSLVDQSPNRILAPADGVGELLDRQPVFRLLGIFTLSRERVKVPPTLTQLEIDRDDAA